MTIKKTTSPGSFRVLVGTRPYGSDPAWNGHTPPTPRNTMDFGQVTTGGAATNARVTPTSPPVGLSGTILVADNDFTTGWAEIFLGNYRLVNGVEYQVGVLAANTATNLAAAINAMQGFRASAIGATVTVVYDAPMGEVEFRAQYRGTKTNFTLAPSTNYLGGGDPTIGPPVLT